VIKKLCCDLLGSAKHEKEYCAMYDICGARSDGKVLNCPFPTSSVKVGCCCCYYYYESPFSAFLVVFK